MSPLSPLASVSATRTIMEKYGLGTKKALGQHFLISDGVVSRICDLAELNDQDIVLEVGPGIGTLTIALLQKASAVIAIERDADLPEVLAETTAAYSDDFALIQKDALEVDLDDVSEATKCLPNKFVANLPYAVAATLVLDFFQKFESIQSATLMVQSEVADRMAARPGTKDYGAYTVKLSLYAKPVSRFLVKPGNFFPPPRVDSAVIRLDRLDNSLDQGVIASTCIMADAAFATRRKTISNSFKTYFKTRPDLIHLVDHVNDLLLTAEIDPKVRGESLETEDFIRLGKSLHTFLQQK